LQDKDDNAELQANFKNLHKWLKANDVDMTNVDFKSFGEEGNGLVSLKDIKVLNTISNEYLNED
jgi:hypothetical protein